MQPPNHRYLKIYALLIWFWLFSIYSNCKCLQKNLDSNKETNDKKQVVHVDVVKQSETNREKEDEASANSSSGCDISENNKESTSALVSWI